MNNCDDGRKYLHDDSFNIVSGKGFVWYIGREIIHIPNWPRYIYIAQSYIVGTEVTNCNILARWHDYTTYRWFSTRMQHFHS